MILSSVSSDGGRNFQGIDLAAHMSAQSGADVCADAVDYLETGSINRLPVLILSKPVPRGLLGLWRLAPFTAFSTPTSAIRNLWSLGILEAARPQAPVVHPRGRAAASHAVSR